MSSTGRGSEREEDEKYFTRYPLALAICERLKADGVITAPDVMMEPSAGAGAFVSAMAEVWAPDVLYANDIDTSLLLEEHVVRAQRTSRVVTSESDFGALAGTLPVDGLIGNPPFSLAEQHIRIGLEMLTDGGALAFLLRVNFLAGIERCAGLWTEHPPEYVYLLDKRPSFKEGYRINKKGKRVKVTTDSAEYAVLVFRKGRPEFEPVVRWIQWSKYLARFRNKVERIEVAA